MDTLETILARRSVRRYKDMPVPADDLKRILYCLATRSFPVLLPEPSA